MPDADVPREGSTQEKEDDENGGDRIDRAWREIAARKELALACTCSTFCFWVILMFVLMIALGSSFFPYESDVPLYLRNHITQQRLDAVIEGKDRATFTLNQAELQLVRSVDSLGGERDDLTLELIYLPRFGDVLELDILKKIREFEQLILRQAGYEEHCLTVYSSSEVAVQDSGDLAAIREINERKHPCAVHSSIAWSCDPSYGYPCSSISSRPIGLFDCPKTNAPCTPDEMVLDKDFKVNKSRLYSEMIPDPRTHDGLNARDFLVLLDSEFGPGNIRAKAFRTEFRFGAPLPGFKTVTDRPDDQSQELASFLFSTYNSLLMEDHIPGDDVEVLFNGHGMLEEYILGILTLDGTYAVGSFIFVLIYIAFMMSSWFLAFMGMGQVLMSAAPAYFLYYGIFQQRYFGVFNTLSIFIILGIGADDIFVFLEAWRSSGDTYGNDLGPRMSHTWKHAGKAMLITSLTTIISFLSNAASSFPAIQSFGIFAAMLVLVNYCAVMVFYPTVVLVYEGSLAEKAFCCGLPEKLSAIVNPAPESPQICAANFRRVPTHTKLSEKDKNGEVAEGNNDEPDKNSSVSSEKCTFVQDEIYEFVPSDEAPINVWFRESYATGIIRGKIIFLVIFAVLLALMISKSTTIQADKEAFKLFPDSDPYQKFLNEKPKHFARGGSVLAVEMVLVWGIQKDDPIDRAGIVATDMDDLGIPRWDTAFHLPTAAPCIHHICTAAEIKDDSRKTGGYPDFPIDCFIVEFKEYIVTAHNQSEWDRITGVSGDSESFVMYFTSWLGNPEVLGRWKPFLYAENVDGVPVLRFVTAELKLTVTQEIDPNKAIGLWETWEAWLQTQYEHPVCAAVASQAQVMQVSMEFAYIRQILVEEAFQGIYMSLSLAFFVLCVATTNVIIALFATIIIACIVICVIGTTVLLGWDLGILESVALVMVPGLAVDFVAHLAEGYVESEEEHREGRVRDMLGKVGISVISGAVSTLGATVFLFFPTIVFFRKFGILMFSTIGFSLLWALVGFPAILSTPLGPQGRTGDWLFLFRTTVLGQQHEGHHHHHHKRRKSHPTSNPVEPPKPFLPDEEGHVP